MADITQTGPVGLSGLKGVNSKSTPEEAMKSLRGIGFGRTASETNRMYRPQVSINRGMQFASMGVGDSIYDKDIQTIGEAQNIEDFRGRTQSGLTQLANGIMKMGTTAATTFLEGTLGTIWGIGQGISNLANPNTTAGFWQGMWDNDFSKAMASIQDDMEKILPNYYTDEQRNSPWYSSANILSANFLGDKLLKNQGFTIGALATTLVPGVNVAWVGKVIAGLGKVIGGASAIKGFATAGKIADRLARTFVSANSEASTEAINAVNSNMEATNHNLQQRRNEAMVAASEAYSSAVASGVDPNKAMQAYLQTVNNIDASIDSAKKQDELDAREVGNSVYGLNLALLAVTNNLEFSKFMKGGYNSQKGIKDLVMLADGKPTDNLSDFARGLVSGTASVGSSAKNIVTPGRIIRGTAGRFMEEGFEEGAQNIISDSNQMQAQAKLNQWADQKYRSNKDKYSLFASTINPDATNDLVDYMKAVNHAWNTNFGTFESRGWEDVFLGGLTGMLGTVGVRPNSRGKLSIGWQGGMYEEYKELSDTYAQNEAKIKEVNDRIAKPEFVKNTRHAVAAMTFANDMNEALQNNNIRLFKNAELMSVLNDALFFKDNNMLDGYKSFYKEASQSITDEDVNEVRSQIRDMETGKSYFDGKTDDELKTILRDKAASTLAKIDSALSNYEEQSLLHKEKFASINPLLAEDAIREMTARRTLYDDLQRRRDELQQKADSIPEATKAITGNNYAKQIEEIDKQMGEIADELKDYNSHPEKLIEDLTRKYELYQKAQIGKDSKKTIEKYQAATTLQEIADAFYFNDKNEDTFNEAIKTAEGDNKALLESFKPFLSELNSAKDAVAKAATEISEDPVIQQQFMDTFGRYVDRALGELINNPNTIYNKESLATAIKNIGDAIEKSTENSEDASQVLAGAQQNTILHSIADYLGTVSTAQAASSAPKNATPTEEVKPEVAPEDTGANEALNTNTNVEDNAAKALKDSAEPLNPTGPKQDSEEFEGTTVESNPPSGGGKSEEEEKSEEKPTNEQLKSEEEKNKPQPEEKKVASTESKADEGTKSAATIKPANSEGNASTSEATEEEKQEKSKQPGQEITENTQKTKDEDAPLPKKSFRGNAFLEYSQSIKSDDQNKAGVAAGRTNKSAQAFFKFLKSEGIDIGYIVNNYLKQLMDRTEDGKLTVQYMTVRDNDGNLRNDVFLVIPYTDEVAKICKDSDPIIAGNIKETNHGKKLIVGVLGFSGSEEGLKAGHKFILDTLNSQRSEVGYDGKYFVGNILENKIYDINPGSIVRRYAVEGTDNPNRNLADLLSDRRTNPHGLSADNIRWAVLEGPDEAVDENDIKYINFDGTERYLSLYNATHPGKVYMFIPGADGVLIPQYVETLTYNNSEVNHDSQYWRDIQGKIDAIFSAKDTEARMIAMNELRKDLLFNTGNNLYYQSNPAETDFDTIKYRKGNISNDVAIDFRDPNLNVEEARKTLVSMIEDINPRLNIKTTVLSNTGGVQYYLDAGLMQVNTRLLGTVNAQSFLYPIDSEGRAIETFQAKKSGENQSRGTASSSETVVYINNEKFYYNGSLFFDALHHEITDEQKLKRLRDIQAIQSGKVQPVELGTKKTKYWEIDGTVYTNYKLGGYYPLTSDGTKQYYKAKARKQAAEDRAKNIEEAGFEILQEEKGKTAPMFSVGDEIIVDRNGGVKASYTIIEHNDGESTGFWKLEDGIIKYWVKPNLGNNVLLISEQELKELAAIEDTYKEGGLTEKQLLGEQPESRTDTPTGKSVVNGETLEGRKSFRDLELQANLANFDNIFRKLSKEKKSLLKEAIESATGKPMKGLKDVRVSLEQSTKEAHALYLAVKTEQDIDKLIDTINSCGI